MEQRTDGAWGVRVQRITADALRIGDEVLDGSAVRQVTSVRLQGTPAEACVELAGIVGRRHYPAGSRVEVQRRHWASC